MTHAASGKTRLAGIGFEDLTGAQRWFEARELEDIDREALLEGLRARGLLYACTCTRADIARAASAPRGFADALTAKAAAGSTGDLAAQAVDVAGIGFYDGTHRPFAPRVPPRYR